MKAKRSSKAQRLSSDIITTLPQAITDTILCLLPIEEAARTSILSREWRYKWTKIPKLKFDLFTVLKTTTKERHSSNRKELSDIEIARRNMDTRCKLFYAIHQVLLLRQGPILDFALSMSAHHACFEIDQIILHLSRNHPVKKLRIMLRDSWSYGYGVPLSFFSLRHLTDLDLANCVINHKPILFSGFGSLTSLFLFRVSISRESLLRLLSNCPSLKTLSLLIHEDHFLGHEYPNIMELLKCLPVVEHLTTWGYLAPLLVQDSVPQELPASLIHLKYFCIGGLGFANGYGLTFLAILIQCCPNVEKIKLEIDEYDEIEPDDLEEYSNTLEKYSDVRLEHLNELDIGGFRNFKPEMEFVKFILVRSPNLKKVILQHYMDKNKELEMTKTLLRTPRASPVEIIVDKPSKGY